MALDLLLHYVLLACNVGDEAISNIMCFIRLCTVYASISLVSMSGRFPGQTSQTNNSPEQLDRHATFALMIFFFVYKYCRGLE